MDFVEIRDQSHCVFVQQPKPLLASGNRKVAQQSAVERTRALGSRFSSGPVAFAHGRREHRANEALADQVLSLRYFIEMRTLQSELTKGKRTRSYTGCGHDSDASLRLFAGSLAG